MRGKNPLSCSQNPINNPFPVPDESSSQPPIVSSTPMSSKWALSFRFSYQIFVCKARLPPMRAICHAHLDDLNNIWRGTQIKGLRRVALSR
jgi:hypothetical protein